MTTNTRFPFVLDTAVNGTKRNVDLNNLSREDVLKEINLLRTQSGLDIVRIRKQWHTDNPSIQGHWHPFYNKPTQLNMETFPTDKPTFSHAKHQRTAKITPELVEELKELKERGTYKDM